jgi:uncharacterized protein YsxB (DUF464 family)
MIQVTYNEVGDEMILRAEGHAGYAEKGKDIVCAAVSVLMQTLACSVGTCMGNDGKGFSVVCKKSNNNIAKFELVTDGLVLLQREYPENVRYINATERKTKALELQLFADGGAASTGDAAPAADNAAEGGADPEATDSAAEGSGSENGEGEAGEEAKKPSPAERRKAFGQMMSGEYKDLADEMMQNAVQIAAQNLEASPEMRGLLEAIAEKYGTDATDLTALTDAIRNGVVKDDAYFEKIAMEKGISVRTAREMDKLETQNKRLTAQQQAAQQMQKAAAERARIAQIQARWDAEAEALKAKYPEFDREEVLANPEVEKMMRAGCSMEAAYRAAYFDRLMARQTAATAQQTEQGVLNRVQQRASRPAENGTRPGGAVQTHLDVEHMSRKDREALEKRVLRGEIITL